MIINKITKQNKEQAKMRGAAGKTERAQSTSAASTQAAKETNQQTKSAKADTTNKAQHCCVIRLALKKNNAFVNITNLNGQTLIKFSIGLIQKKNNTTNKKQLRALVK
jgi:hypothetical protein